MVTVMRQRWWLSAGDGGDDEMMVVMTWRRYAVAGMVAGGDLRWEMEASVLCRCGVDDDGGVAGIWPERGYGFFNEDVAKIACNKLYNENEAVVPIKVQVQLRPISMATAAACTTAVKVLIKG
ncbi:hypothetical protein Tco_0488902 [Tanacetum coccineum]